MQEKLNLFNNSRKNNKAQGTIEYLVIIGIIVIIGLVTVSLSTNFLDSGSQISNTTGNIKSTIGSGGISVTEAITDSDGDVILTLKNNTSEKMTLTSITPLDASGNAGTTERYDKVIHYGETINFSYPTNTSCVCSENETTKTCYYEIELTSAQGLIKKETITINVNCTNNTTTDQNTQPLDTTAPTINLSSPETNTNTSSKIISFTFTATDDEQINSCTLQTGNDSNTYNLINNGTETTIQYTFSNDLLADWNISCTDGRNTTTSTTRTIDVDTNQYQITTCLELQEMNNNLAGNYELMNDIDCSDTLTWNNGLGFEPISNSSNRFSGNFNGNNYTISNLYINRPNQEYVALFGFIAQETNEIKNISLVDVNITGLMEVAGISGMSGTISNSNVSGTITGIDYYVGGIIATSGRVNNSYNLASINGPAYVGGIIATSGIITNSYNLGTINGIESFIGGISGAFSTITRSYNLGIVNGYDAVGGLDGFNGTITDSYNFGSVTGSSYVGGISGNSATILRSYNAGQIYGSEYTGGLSGGWSNITNSFSVGQINYNQDYYSRGGIDGFKDNTSISNCYWDLQLTGEDYCYFDSPTEYKSNVGCTSTDNNALAYYGASGIPFEELGWSTDIWTPQDNNYPILSWQTE